VGSIKKYNRRIQDKIIIFNADKSIGFMISTGLGLDGPKINTGYRTNRLSRLDIPYLIGMGT
jgi:hypothetical protein